VAASLAALIAGILLAITLARSITRPLGNAVAVARAVRTASSTIRSTFQALTKPAELLSSLDSMQNALREREERDADYRGQILAIGKSQTVAEFGMDGRDPRGQREFPQRDGLLARGIRGQHHSVLVDPARARNRSTARCGTRWRAANSRAASTVA
jgi:hypothetical protein